MPSGSSKVMSYSVLSVIVAILRMMRETVLHAPRLPLVISVNAPFPQPISMEATQSLLLVRSPMLVKCIQIVPL